jgi:hypothetical protein
MGNHFDLKTQRFEYELRTHLKKEDFLVLEKSSSLDPEQSRGPCRQMVDDVVVIGRNRITATVAYIMMWIDRTMLDFSVNAIRPLLGILLW